MHGRNPKNSLGAFDREAARNRQHDYLYAESELAEWAKRIEQTSRFADRTVVIFNNDAGGKSFVNALQLREMLMGVRSSAPKELRRRYPIELHHFGPRHAEQQCLFSAA
jgi:uncharacterized protein YecE (DUF72 family)